MSDLSRTFKRTISPFFMSGPGISVRSMFPYTLKGDRFGVNLVVDVDLRGRLI